MILRIIWVILGVFLYRIGLSVSKNSRVLRVLGVSHGQLGQLGCRMGGSSQSARVGWQMMVASRRPANIHRHKAPERWCSQLSGFLTIGFRIPVIHFDRWDHQVTLVTPSGALASPRGEASPELRDLYQEPQQGWWATGKMVPVALGDLVATLMKSYEISF